MAGAMIEWLDWETEALEQLEEEMRHMRRSRRVVPDRMNPFQAMSDTEFTERFRLRKESENELIQEIQPSLPVANDKRG